MQRKNKTCCKERRAAKKMLQFFREENAALKKMLRDNNICPYGMLPPGEPMAKCPSGFPGCGCADDVLLDEMDKETGS